MIKIRNNSWNKLFEQNNIKNMINKINDDLKKDVELLEGLVDIFPYTDKILNCFDLTSFNNLNNSKEPLVVLIGQDPYIKKFEINNEIVPQAMGLSFSVPKEIDVPPSLRNIYKELKDDLDIEIANHGDLTKWAKQGVLLLNRSLTVRENNSNSHKKIWNGFMEEVVNFINKEKENCVFILWGNDAKKIKKNIDINKHLVLEATHPSPLGANKGGFFGCKHFSKTNEYLKKHNKNVIDWDLN